MKKFLIFIPLFLIVSCSNLEFIYKNNESLINPIYNDVEISVSGVDLPIINQYISSYFGSAEKPSYKLEIKIDEKKTKTSVESNQTISKLRYDMTFFYKLSSNQNCVIYKKKLSSNFSITPKSSGYDFGSDKSLDKQYELSVIENFNQFINHLSEIDFLICDNES